jgi:hypothetical protein
MFAILASEEVRAGARLLALPPAYRVPGRGAEARTGAGGHEVDVEGCVALALMALGCAARVGPAIARHELFSSEATLCAVLLVLALVPLLHEAGRWLAARARALTRAPGRRAAPPGETETSLEETLEMDAIYLGLALAFFVLSAGLVRLCSRLEGGAP